MCFLAFVTVSHSLAYKKAVDCSGHWRNIHVKMYVDYLFTNVFIIFWKIFICNSIHFKSNIGARLRRPEARVIAHGNSTGGTNENG